jgi:vancomycin permeability regulator SanA
MKWALALAAGFVVVLIGGANLVVWLGGRSPVTQDPHDVPTLQVREALARVKTLGDAVSGADPKFLGPQIAITGDGQRPWGR